MLDDRQLGQCAWVVGEVIAQRRIAGNPVPHALTALHRALCEEVDAVNLRRAWQGDVSASGHGTTEIGSMRPELESSADVAQRLGITDRTVRRRAAREGVRKIGGRYLFDRDEAS